MEKHRLWFAGQKRRLWIGLSMALVSLLILVACGGTAANSTPTPVAQATPTATPTPLPATQSTNVVIVQMLENPPGHYFFKPDSLTITAGTTVVWIDNSDAPHTVTSDTNVFDTPSNITEGKTFGLVFNTPGTYNYHCKIHPNMKAVITVTS
jgi:plastocyanin